MAAKTISTSVRSKWTNGTATPCPLPLHICVTYAYSVFVCAVLHTYIRSCMQSDLREDYSVDFPSATAAGAANTQHPMNPVDIAKGLHKSVIKWNSEYKGSGGRGPSSQWMQQLKNNFTFLMRFQNPNDRQESWQQHLEKAANLTIEQMCPNREFDNEQRAMYESIRQKGLSTRCPISNWLNEKAYAWLKWLSKKPERPIWYPVHAIEVAYELFLRGTLGKFSTFRKKLAEKSSPEIREMLQAHAPNVISVPGSNAVAHNAHFDCLHLSRNNYVLNLLIDNFTTKWCTKHYCNFLLMSSAAHAQALPHHSFANKI